MAEWAGGGEHYFVCDGLGCNNETVNDVNKSDFSNAGLPSTWYFLAIGNGECLECADTVKHFCCIEHLRGWLFDNQGSFED